MSAPDFSLRPMTEADRDALVAVYDDWDVIRMTSSFPLRFDRAFAEQMVARYAAFDGLADIGWVTDVDGAVAGTLSLHRQAPGVFEIAYALGRAWWGRGLATQVAHRGLTYAGEKLRARRIVAGVYHDNPGSMRVLKKLGFRATGEVTDQPNQVRAKPEPVRQFAIDLHTEDAA